MLHLFSISAYLRVKTFSLSSGLCRLSVEVNINIFNFVDNFLSDSGDGVRDGGRKMSDSRQTEPKAIAFSFSKKVKQNTVFVNNKLIEDVKNEAVEAKDFVTAIDDNQIHSIIKKEAKKELVIPLIVNNRYTVKRDSSKPNKNQLNQNENNDSATEVPHKEETLDDIAKRELLREAMQVDSGEKESTRVIPVFDTMLKNKVPEGFETDGNFDVSLRPEEPSVANYDEVPVEEFGLALLKGMGWKPGMAIGANTKEVYVPKEPQIRPKGLGLGADISAKSQITAPSKDLKEEDLQPKKGSLVCIEFGAHKGAYGVIEDFDDDMSRVTVRLTVKKECVKTPVALLRVVSKKEFESEGKVINKSQYEAYKSKEEVKDRAYDKRKSDSTVKSEPNSRYDDNYRRHSSHKSWLLPNLRVRIIDKNYKKGVYYKEKVVISDVQTSHKCSCRTSDHKLLEDIDSNMLETVIPRESDANVMILEGKYRKQLGFVLKKNRDKSEADVQLSSDRRKVITLSFDHICEYIQ